MLSKTNIPHYVSILSEASKCLCCYDPPCMKGCPVNIPVGDFIRRIRFGDNLAAAKLILSENPFGTICGFVCPEENLCEKNCTRAKIDKPIAIRELQKYVTWYEGANINYEKKGKINGKVAILGAGPAGLTCACILAINGVDVDIYDKKKFPGGVPINTLPAFRLPDRALKLDIQRILKLKVNFINKDISVLTKNDVKKYNAIFISLGLGKGYSLNVEGENLQNVFSAEEFLEKLKKGENLPQAETIVVIGGGNTAMDCALSAKKYYKNARVILSYRRSYKEMPAWEKEKIEVFKHGIDFMYQTIPVKIKGDKKVEEIIFRRTKLVKEEGEKRAKPIEIPNSDFSIKADVVVKAIGQYGVEEVKKLFSDIELTSKYLIKVDETLKTSINNVFAGGDIVNGGDTIVQAVADGKKAAASILELLKGGK